MDKNLLHSISYLTPQEIEAYLTKITSENELFKNLLDIQKDGLILVDKELKIDFFNKKANEILNFELYRNVQPFYSYISIQILREAFEKSLSAEKVYKEEFKVEKDKIVKYISLYGIPFGEKYLFVISDITEKKKELYELKRLESLAAVSNVSSLLAHDINNPLSAISIQVDLIDRNLGRKKDDFHHEHLSIIKTEIDRVKSIVRNFLYSAKPLEITPLLHDSQALIDSLVNFIKPTLDEKKITLTLDTRKPLPYLEYDFDLMYSAILNLIKNAIEAMEESKVKELKLSAMRVANSLMISVSDTGCGISDKDMEDIFKPYFTTKKSGTGLGLSNVYKILKLHGGDIRVERKEKGSEFILYLPLGKENSIGIDFNPSSH